MEIPIQDPVPDSPDWSAAVSERIERIGDIELVRKCLPLLRARPRAVLNLHMSGRSREEIATELELSPHAVTQLTRRALDSLDSRLKQQGYVRGLVPWPLMSWLREKSRWWSQWVGQLGRSAEMLVPIAAMLASTTFSLQLAAEVPRARIGVPADARMPSFVSDSSQAEVRVPSGFGGSTQARAATSNRARNVTVDHGGTKIGVDAWQEEKPEPPLDEQVMDFINHPGQAFPDCPTNLPCPWGDS